MIYLDYNATAPIDPRVAEAMIPYLHNPCGNSSSAHAMGARGRTAVDLARRQVASLLGAHPEEIIFTSGGTESNNQAIKGVASARRNRGRHIVTTSIEHPATVGPCKFLADWGFETTFLPVDQNGLVDPLQVKQAIRPDTILISVMHANNEVGTIEPIAEIAEYARSAGVVFHADAAQSLGKIPVDVGALGVDLLSVAGHKLYAPHGVGALYVRGGVELEPLLHGAGHERGLRSGTEAVPNIVALGKAAELAQQLLGDHAVGDLCRYFHDTLKTLFGERVVLNGHPTQRLPNTLNVSFMGRDGQEILDALEGVCSGTGAACHSGVREPSAVMKAMGIDRARALAAIRFSLGRFNTRQEIDQVVDMLRRAVS